MSFSIQAAGLVDDAVEQIKAVKLVGENPQFDETRAFLLAQLAAWPSEGAAKGVLVEASGHRDGYTQNLTLTIRPLWLRIPEPEGDA